MQAVAHLDDDAFTALDDRYTTAGGREVVVARDSFPAHLIYLYGLIRGGPEDPHLHPLLGFQARRQPGKGAVVGSHFRVRA